MWAIPVFGIIILMHELGHFTAAKLCGIRVHEFAIGFGPALAGFTRGETRYSLRLFLILGGFVRMAGMEDGETADPRGFAAKPVWQRVAVIAAGPLMNFVLAALLFAGLVKVTGEARLPVVGAVLPESPAAAAGLQAEDRVVSVNGRPIGTWADLVREVHGSGGDPVQLVVERGGAARTLEVQPMWGTDENRWVLGIRPKLYPISTFTALSRGSEITGLYTREWFREVGRMIARRVAPQVAGPVRIIGTIAEVSQRGLGDLINLAAVLSINIGIVNLIPIPALDGSRLMFLALEWVRGRRMDPLRENMIHFVGLMFLLGLVILITIVNDIPGLQ